MLAGFAQSTGGRYFLTPNASELKNIYDQIGLELAGQYLISYTSNLPANGTTREVQVRYQDSMSAKAYQAPSTKEVTESTSTPAPAPQTTPTKKQTENAGLGNVDTILRSKGIVINGNSKQVTVSGNGLSVSQDSNSESEATPQTTPEKEKKSAKAPEWLPVPDAAKGAASSGVGGQKQLSFTVDQPVNDVVDFYQQRLTALGLRIVSASTDASQIFIVTGSGKNAKIVIASKNENQTVVQITYAEE